MQITTQQNIAMGITNYFQRSIRAMDPYFIFPLIGVPEWCTKGTAAEGAIWVLENYGNKPPHEDLNHRVDGLKWAVDDSHTGFSAFSKLSSDT